MLTTRGSSSIGTTRVALSIVFEAWAEATNQPLVLASSSSGTMGRSDTDPLGRGRAMLWWAQPATMRNKATLHAVWEKILKGSRSRGASTAAGGVLWGFITCWNNNSNQHYHPRHWCTHFFFKSTLLIIICHGWRWIQAFLLIGKEMLEFCYNCLIAG